MQDIYLFGSIVVTTGLLLDSSYPKPDGYAELSQVDLFLGGECGVAAAILDHFGCSSKVIGFQLGYETEPIVKSYFQGTKVDVSAQTTDENWVGVRDYVVIDQQNHTRTCLGSFEHMHSMEKHHWDMPIEKDIAESFVAGIDPHLCAEKDEAVRLCDKQNIPYVTYDCTYDSILHQKSAINVVSSCYLREQYPQYIESEMDELLSLYTHQSKGLTIFTFGSNPIHYGRGDSFATDEPFKLDIRSTLSAGDSYRTGCIYGLYKGMEDKDIVRFASALAGCALMQYPITNHLPDLEDVLKLFVG
ncbi:PfkB family carbohydrate kinase [[Clostridium] fimetarium]|uniref:Sugar or nucleoside kinase, ribokinase family n=1 Tax=[Clostridium] fimetarium TaxID=99656 RepID=A0A1I0M6U1_9FIRM|nr:PfkB family carbohydrate kinase [[Clostridium] fimetarium]SEV83500.1 Sugar or nucleoside kinase, ribokinase family [[Clostridium] fimetarium]